MVTVGLGKQAGAQEAHSHGLWESVREVPELTMAKAKISDAARFSEQCAAIESPYADQARHNALVMKAEAAKMR